MGNILFSFDGKIGRGVFLKYSVILVVVALLIAALFGAAVGAGVFYGPGGLVGLVFLWMWLALFVKRGRDIGVHWLITVPLAILLSIFTWIAFLIIKKI